MAAGVTGMTKVYQWSNPIRVGGAPVETTPLADRTHIPDPAAVARLRAFMAEQDAAKRAAGDERAAAKERADAAAKRARALRAKRRATEAAKADAARPPKTAKTAKTPRQSTGRPAGWNLIPAPRKLSDEQARALHARWLAGERQNDLAAGAGVSDVTLRRRWAALELPSLPPEDMRTRTGMPSALTEAQAVAAHKRYMAGTASSVLADELGINRQKLIRAFHRYGLTVKEQKTVTARPFHPALTPAAVREAIARNAAGEEWKAIAASLGCCARALRLARRRLESEPCQ